ncbi:MAG TPA: VanZ family protein, partial [Burkholderiaceae bacterium]
MNAHANPGRSAMVALLLVAWAALIVYASWFPLTGWRWPAGASVWTLLRLPWPRGQSSFDIVSNLLGYVPLGALLVLAPGHPRGHGVAAVRDATVLAAVLSYALEVGQNLLPLRVPSLLDWLLNTAGSTV